MQTLEWLQEPDPRLSLNLSLCSGSRGRESLAPLCWWKFGVVSPLHQWGRRSCTITGKKGGGLQAVLRSETTWGFLGVFTPLVQADTRPACTAVLAEQGDYKPGHGHRALLTDGKAVSSCPGGPAVPRSSLLCLKDASSLCARGFLRL